MGEEVLAKNIMRKVVPCLSFEATVPEAIEYFKKQEYGFALVQASASRFQGVLTEGNLMRIYLRHRAHPSEDGLIMYRQFFESAQLIHEDEPFAEIIKKLVTSERNRIFVINGESEVVGFISVRDILPHLSLQGADGKFKSTPTPIKEAAFPAEGDAASDLYLYETFFSQSPFLMHSVNREGVIRMANSILHRVLGYGDGELIGSSVFDIYPKNVMDLVRQSLSEILDDGDFKVVKGQMVHKTGQLVDVEMVSRALLNQKGTVIGTVTVTRPLDMAFLLNCMPHL